MTIVTTTMVTISYALTWLQFACNSGVEVVKVLAGILSGRLKSLHFGSKTLGFKKILQE